MNRQSLTFWGTTLLYAAIAGGATFGQAPRHTGPEAVASAKAARVTRIAQPSSCKQIMDAAVSAFKQGDDLVALELVNDGLRQCPGNLELLEFRGLVLFAKGDYHEASAAIHKVMAAGPGWNWATMHSVCPHVDTYTTQLRALEAFTRKHPDDGAARFLQGYHYIVGGYPDAAVKELQMVVRLEYDDQIAVALIKKLAKPVISTPTTTVPGRGY